jgi:hypothetical protein
MSWPTIKCACCGGRIPKHEPDLVLRDLDNGGRPRYYHTRCGEAAYATAAQKPALYRLTVRSVEEVAN